MESEQLYHGIMNLVQNKEMWRQDAKEEEVGAALTELYRTEDPQCLAGLLRKGETEQETEQKRHENGQNYGGYCDQCKSGLIQDLARHKRQQHGNREIFMCREPCKYKTTRNEDMKRHQEGAQCVITNPGRLCQFCGVLKQSLASVERHLLRNQCLQQYKCLNCDQTFSLKSRLKHHIKGSHK